MQETPELDENPRKALYEVFEQLNTQLEQESGIDTSFSGSTSVSILLHKQSIYCCNIGDSRAVVGKRTNERWSVIPLSRDHKPTDKDEAQRIILRGGRVDAFRDPEGRAIGPQRVWLQNDNVPGLAMTRSLGDQVAASVGVTWKPEIVEYESTSNDKIIVIGSDGLWEFIENKEVIKLLVPYYLRQDIEGACDCLLQEALLRWHRESNVVDDITFVIIFMNI